MITLTPSTSKEINYIGKKAVLHREFFNNNNLILTLYAQS